MEFDVMQISEKDEAEYYEEPSYSDPGRILVRILGPSSVNVYRYESEILDYDADSSVYWLHNGMGIEVFLDNVDEIETPGCYVIEGVTGQYIRGDRWATDDDEKWKYKSVRQATQEEIDSETLGG